MLCPCLLLHIIIPTCALTAPSTHFRLYSWIAILSLQKDRFSLLDHSYQAVTILRLAHPGPQ